MLQITLSGKKPDPHVPDREFYGWLPEQSIADNWEANRGHWRIDRDARGEQFVVFTHHGQYVMAAEITDVAPSQYRVGRRVLSGRVLTAGHPIHDLFVDGGLTPPVVPTGAQNPIRYLDDTDVARITLAGRTATV